MIDGEKIFKALKLGKVTGLGCTLTSAECDYLIAHDDVLTQYITLLEKEQRWISVSERLPEKAGTYLVYYKKYLEMANFDLISTKWQICFAGMITDIDYWMPLPNPPVNQLTAHDATERQDDKSPNNTQTQTIVYGKESENGTRKQP